MDAGSWFGPAFAGERVPLYQDALEFCLAHKLWMNVEIKPAAGHEAQTGTAVASLTREWLGADAAGQVLFSSFSPLALQAAQAAAPDIARAWLLTKLPADWLARAQALRLSSVHLNHRQLNAESSARIRERGYGLFCYTVNTQSAWQRLAALGVDAICTDRIDLFPADAFALAAG
jgi:glycerophosphoryl diester phosphodiesterase